MKIIKLIISTSILIIIACLISILLMSSGYKLFLIFEPIIFIFCFVLGYGLWQENNTTEIKHDIFNSRLVFLALVLWPFIFFINCIKDLNLRKD